jgi:hypothetical protein
MKDEHIRGKEESEADWKDHDNRDTDDHIDAREDGERPPIIKKRICAQIIRRKVCQRHAEQKDHDPK